MRIDSASQHFTPHAANFNFGFRLSMPVFEQQELQPQVLAPTIMYFLPAVRSQCKGPCLKLDVGPPDNLKQQ